MVRELHPDDPRLKAFPSGANPALVLPPGIVVLDVDPRNGGTLDGLPGPTPATLTVRTPSGGWHFYYRSRQDPAAVTWPRGALGPGVDLLATVGEAHELRARYVLIPEAVVGGQAYAIADDAPIAEAPEWLEAAARPRAAAGNEGSGSGIRVSAIPDAETREVPPDELDPLARFILESGLYAEGRRHTAALQVAGTCAQACWREDTTLELMRVLVRLAHDDDLEDRLRAVRDTFARLRSGQEIATLEDAGEDAREIESRLWLAGHFQAQATPFQPVVATAPLNIYSGQTLVKACPDPPAYLVDGLLVRNKLALLAGPPKCGKTTFLHSLVAALLQGHLFLRRETYLPPDEAILWLSEEPRDLFAHRIRNLEPQAQARLLCGFRREATPAYRWERLLSELEHALATGGLENLALLIVDTFQDWVDIAGEAENHTGTLQASIKPLARFAERARCAVVLVHHTRKTSTGSYVTDLIRGGTALSAAADHLLLLGTKTHRTTGRMLTSVGRLSALCWEAAVQLLHDRYELASRSPGIPVQPTAEPAQAQVQATGKGGRGRPPSLNEEDLLRALRERGPVDLDTLAAAFNVSKNTVYRYLARLRAAGRLQVTYENRGPWARALYQPALDTVEARG